MSTATAKQKQHLAKGHCSIEEYFRDFVGIRVEYVGFRTWWSGVDLSRRNVSACTDFVPGLQHGIRSLTIHCEKPILRLKVAQP